MGFRSDSLFPLGWVVGFASGPLQGPVVTQNILGNGVSWTVLTNSTFLFTPNVLRNLVLIACLDGYQSAAAAINYQVTLDGTALVTGTFGINPVNSRISLPPLQFLIPSSSLSLTSHTLKMQVQPANGVTFSFDSDDMVSYSLH